MEFSLYRNTSLNSVSEDTRNAVLNALKKPLEENISDTKKSVELINSLLDYISFLEGIFLEDGQYFTEEDFKTPGLSSLLMTSNRHDEKEKREILEFFKDQYKTLYPRIFTGEGFETIFGFDNPASILIDAKEKVKIIKALKIFYSEDEIKNIDITKEEVIKLFDFINVELLKAKLEIIGGVCKILGIENILENTIKYLKQKLLSTSFSWDQDDVSLFNSIEICLDGLKKVDGFDFEGIFDVDLYNLRRGSNYDCLFEAINYFQIKSAKYLSNKGVEEILKCEEYNMVYFEGITLQINKYEGWLGRKFTLEEAGNGTLKNIKQIYEGAERYKVDIKNIRVIFDYLDKDKKGIKKLSTQQISYIIIFCKDFVGIEITQDNIIEKVEVLREIVGINIDLEWFLDTDLFDLLRVFVGKAKEQSYKEVDIKNLLYKPFFQKFNRFVGVNEKGEKQNENWEKKHFKGDENEIRSILMQNSSVDFILLFSDEFEDISDVLNNPNFQLFYQNVGNENKKAIVNFIKFVRKYSLFEIKLENITQEFIRFCEKNFLKDSSNKFSLDINFPPDFFDEEITMQSFEDTLFKSLIISTKVGLNLENICGLYNLPITLSSYKSLLSEYNKKYGGVQDVLSYLTGTLVGPQMKFIYHTFPKEFTKENIIFIVFSQKDFLCDIGMNYYNGLIKEKEQLLQENFGEKACNYFKKDENGNYIFNRDKKTLLKLIFDKDVILEKLENFLITFSGVTLSKLVRFYRDSGIGFKYECQERSALNFLIQYALDNDNYYYLEHNINILNIERNDLYIFSYHPDFNLDKLKILLDKTGGFLTETFVLKFVIGNCSEEELDNLIQSFSETSEKLLSSEQIIFDKVDENIAEAVFMAYRPTGYTLGKIIELLKYYLQDNSAQLEKLKFKKAGYERDLHITTKRLKSGETVNKEKVGKIEKEVLGVQSGNEFEVDTFDFKLFFTSATDLEKIFPLLGQIYAFNHDYRIEEYRKNIGNTNYDYSRLYSLSNIFGVITKDSFSDILENLFAGMNLEQLQSIFQRLGNIKDSKFKKLFSEIYKQEYFNDGEKLFSCFIEIFSAQLKFIASRIKKEIEKEMKKFQDEKGGEGKKVRFNVCKNITSYFAMAGSELCTDGDIERHNEERYIPVNIIYDEGKQIIGMLMMYIESERDYLVVRGFNVRKDIFNRYNIDSIVESMVSFVGEFAKENSYKKVYIPENGSQHVVSNSDEIRKCIGEIVKQNKQKENHELETTFYCGRIEQEWGFKVEKLYLLLDL